MEIFGSAILVLRKFSRNKNLEISMSERSRRFRRFRRRTADDFNNRPAIIRRDGNNLSRDGNNLASNSLVDDRLTDLTPRDESSFNHQRNPRRKSIKRDREDDISTGNKVH